MKLKNDLVLRQVADTWVVLPMNRNVLSFDGMMTLNETGAILWNLLQQSADEETMVKALLAEYNVSREQARSDVSDFVKKLLDAGCIEE